MTASWRRPPPWSRKVGRRLEQLDGSPTTLELRGLGSILHDFYTGIEQIMERIATTFDGELPAGANWHVQFLDRMTSEIESVRPAVLSSDLADALRPYLRFRHLFRSRLKTHLGSCEAAQRRGIRHSRESGNPVESGGTQGPTCGIFRRPLRNIYGTQLRWEFCRGLATEMGDVWEKIPRRNGSVQRRVEEFTRRLPPKPLDPRQG